jgi:hypothetical protein
MAIIYNLRILTKRINFLTFLILSLFVISCDKESPKPEAPVEESGFLKAHFATIADLRIEKTTGSSFNYAEHPTSRGYIFKPLRDIKITSLGAMIAEKGTYKISLAKPKSSDIMAGVVQVIDSLVVTDTENFTYKKLQKPIILKADSIYTLSYFAINHSAVYDAVNLNLFAPFTTADIQIQNNYYAYYYLHPSSNKYIPGEWGWFDGIIMRGLVDFIYEEI